jgi:hypothetical protein
MPWTINAMGMPGPVRASLASQFASAKHNAEGLATERVTIEAIEKAVNSELDLLIGQLDRKTAVRVTSAGSAEVGVSPGAGGGPQLSLRIECLPDFLSHGRTEESDES